LEPPGGKKRIPLLDFEKSKEMIRLRKVVMVMLAFAESETASTTTLGLGFLTVWVQTPHRFGLLYYGLDWSTRMEFQSFITIDFVRFRHGTLLWWFVSHFTSRFFTFVPCQVTGLLVFVSLSYWMISL
jgi:hypothetical protein